MTVVTWVLILYVSSYSGFTTQEFTSKERCEAAAVEAKKVTSFTVYASCVEK